MRPELERGRESIQSTLGATQRNAKLTLGGTRKGRSHEFEDSNESRHGKEVSCIIRILNSRVFPSDLSAGLERERARKQVGFRNTVTAGVARDLGAPGASGQPREWPPHCKGERVDGRK